MSRMDDRPNAQRGLERRARVWDEPVAKLSDAVLEEELTIAACAPGRLRYRRYQDLWQERRKRRITA